MATLTTLQRGVSRNDPCPCGSGRRYKDCHGSLRATAAPEAHARMRKSQYRPEGEDWAGISEEACDHLGALMELALKHQLEGRMRDAERTYRAVLEQAPRTHDALHMLGVVRLGLGDFSDAQRLIRAAMALRAPYPAIEKNWSIVRRSIAARDRRGIDLLSDAALPLLFGAIAAPASSHARSSRPRDAESALHIVGLASGAATDAQWVADRVGHLLASLKPEVWHARDRVSAEAWQSFDRHRLDPGVGQRPRNGDVIIVGVEGETDAWLQDPIHRVLVFALSATPSLCLERLRAIAADGARSLALVFDSRARARHFGLRDFIAPPPIDLAEYAETSTRERRPATSKLRVATVGQDGRRVVVAPDLDLLRAVASHAAELLLFDPGPLRYEVGMTPTIRCVARDESSFADLVTQADVYLHRPNPWWAEDAGRALFGAMALGVPVLCPRDSMHAEYIDDGAGGWIYDDPPTALAILDALSRDPSRIAHAGRSARTKTLRLFDARALTDAYLSVVRRWRASA